MKKGKFLAIALMAMFSFSVVSCGGNDAAKSDAQSADTVSVEQADKACDKACDKQCDKACDKQCDKACDKPCDKDCEK